jgi:hypothetical protein
MLIITSMASLHTLLSRKWPRKRLDNYKRGGFFVAASAVCLVGGFHLAASPVASGVSRGRQLQARSASH